MPDRHPSVPVLRARRGQPLAAAPFSPCPGDTAPTGLSHTAQSNPLATRSILHFVGRSWLLTYNCCVATDKSSDPSSLPRDTDLHRTKNQRPAHGTPLTELRVEGDIPVAAIKKTSASRATWVGLTQRPDPSSTTQIPSSSPTPGCHSLGYRSAKLQKNSPPRTFAQTSRQHINSHE